eukprot:TRINITY_DN11683_c0_g1_i1.p1 TRINITY_DN11683_c0_g1~~TRINITY_DN11683_c0_g1_i1.p1  ORF type:complete len:337 (-),score=90.49 TRINITY_DN11683_c0_g1_i1:234-1244(-)
MGKKRLFAQKAAPVEEPVVYEEEPVQNQFVSNKSKKKSKTGDLSGLTPYELDERERELVKLVRTAGHAVNETKAQHQVVYGNNDIRAANTKRYRAEYLLAELVREKERRRSRGEAGSAIEEEAMRRDQPVSAFQAAFQTRSDTETIAGHLLRSKPPKPPGAEATAKLSPEEVEQWLNSAGNLSSQLGSSSVAGMDAAKPAGGLGSLGGVGGISPAGGGGGPGLLDISQCRQAATVGAALLPPPPPAAPAAAPAGKKGPMLLDVSQCRAVAQASQAGQAALMSTVPASSWPQAGAGRPEGAVASASSSSATNGLTAADVAESRGLFELATALREKGL